MIFNFTNICHIGLSVEHSKGVYLSLDTLLLHLSQIMLLLIFEVLVPLLHKSLGLSWLIEGVASLGGFHGSSLHELDLSPLVDMLDPTGSGSLLVDSSILHLRDCFLY